MITSQELAAVELPIVRVRAGYEVESVTALIERVSAALRHYEEGGAAGEVLTARELKRTGLQPTMFREGYGAVEVDALIKRAVAALTEYEAR